MGRVRRLRPRWLIATAVLIVLFLGIALSRRIYPLTIGWLPGEETWPRKALSIVAFTIVAYVADRALGRTRRRLPRALAIGAAFSALIEVAQRLHHSHESVRSSGIDVACGALGGWLAVLVRRYL